MAGAQEGYGGQRQGLPVIRKRTVTSLEAERPSSFVKRGAAMRRREVLRDQFGVERQTIEAAQAAEQPKHLLIPLHPF